MSFQPQYKEGDSKNVISYKIVNNPTHPYLPKCKTNVIKYFVLNPIGTWKKSIEDVQEDEDDGYILNLDIDASYYDDHYYAQLFTNLR